MLNQQVPYHFAMPSLATSPWCNLHVHKSAKSITQHGRCHIWTNEILLTHKIGGPRYLEAEKGILECYGTYSLDLVCMGYGWMKFCFTALHPSIARPYGPQLTCAIPFWNALISHYTMVQFAYRLECAIYDSKWEVPHFTKWDYIHKQNRWVPLCRGWEGHSRMVWYFSIGYCMLEKSMDEVIINQYSSVHNSSI